MMEAAVADVMMTAAGPMSVDGAVAAAVALPAAGALTEGDGSTAGQPAADGRGWVDLVGAWLPPVAATSAGTGRRCLKTSRGQNVP